MSFDEDAAIDVDGQTVVAEGYVELPMRRRRGGRPKGQKNKPRELPELSREMVRIAADDGTCAVCGVTVSPLTLDLVRELVRAARDRVQEVHVESAPQSAVTDTLYLAARFDGLCSIGCWRVRMAGR